MWPRVQSEVGASTPLFPSAPHLEGDGRDILTLAICRASKCLLVSGCPAAEVALPVSPHSVSSMVLTTVFLYRGEGQGCEAA